MCSRAGRRSERLPLPPPVYLLAEIGAGPLECCSASAHRLVPSYAKGKSAPSPRGKPTFGRSSGPFCPRWLPAAADCYMFGFFALPNLPREVA